MRTAFCSAEVFPFAKVGGLGDVCGALPPALERLGEEVLIIMPRYRDLAIPEGDIEELDPPFARARIGRDIAVYLIGHDDFFDRDGIYGDETGEYPDNLERFQYYCAQVFELLRREKIKVDLLHCHDWHAALVPVYLKEKYGRDPHFAGTKSILTIHNLGYQGIFPREFFPKLGLNESLFTPEGLEFFNQINILKGGIVFSDLVTTVSPRYAEEILTLDAGCGLHNVLQDRHGAVRGVLNGLDYEVWDPQKDKFLSQVYSPDTPEGKKDNKKDLQRLAGLPEREDVPLFGYVGRLAAQKGLDLIAKTIDQLLQMDLQLVFLGTGEESYHLMLRDLAAQYGGKIAAFLEFSEEKAHKVYAGSDIFLMPSQYEPCGLGQLISLKYGTIPLVHKTGGLADTVVPFDAPDGRGNGFLFEEYHRDALLGAVETARKVFHKRETFEQLRRSAFACDFSWDRSAREYQRIYRQCGEKD